MDESVSTVTYHCGVGLNPWQCVHCLLNVDLN